MLKIQDIPQDAMGFPGGSHGKESACKGRRPGSDPWVRKIPWKREWLLSPVFFPAEFHGQRSLAGFHPRGHTAWGMGDRPTRHLSRTQHTGIGSLSNKFQIVE